MADITGLVLQHIDKSDKINTLELAESLKEDHQKIVGAVKSLQALGDVIEAEQQVIKRLHLTDEGKVVLANGSHEAQIFKTVPKDGIAQDQLMISVPNSRIGFSKAMQAGWITIDKLAEGGPKVLRKVESITDEVQIILGKIDKLDLSDVTDAQTNEYKKRKLITEVKVTTYLLSKGPNFTLKVEKQENELTPEMITSYEQNLRKMKYHVSRETLNYLC